MKKLLGLLLVAFLGGIMALATSRALENRNRPITTGVGADISFQKASYMGGEPVNGPDFVDAKEKRWLGADCGLKVLNLREGQLKGAGVNKNFIITMVDKQIIKNTDDLKKALSSKTGVSLLKEFTLTGSEVGI